MFRSLALSALTLCLLGCGGSSDGYSGPYGQVSGKITMGGQPIPQGSQIVFQAKEGKNYMATGIVAANGEYSMMYNAGKDIPAITYSITVMPPTTSSAPAKMSSDQMANPGQVLTSAQPAAPPFPDRYSNAVRSGLEYAVKAGKNTHDITLEVR